VRVPERCLGFEFADGRRVDARRGVVDLDDDQLRWLRRVADPRLRDQVALDLSATRQGGGRVCACRRTRWPWERACPRCGRAEEDDRS